MSLLAPPDVLDHSFETAPRQQPVQMDDLLPTDPTDRYPEVKAVQNLDLFNRVLLTEALAGYLCTNCTVEQIYDHAGSVVDLYNKSSKKMVRFGAKDVDVFGEAAVFALLELDTVEARNRAEEVERTRRIVSSQQHVKKFEPFVLNFRLTHDGYYSGAPNFPADVYGAD